MNNYEKEIQQSNTIIVVTMFLFIYLLIGAVTSSYIGEKYNTPITVREYMKITLSLPALFFVTTWIELEKMFEDSTPILDRCIIECQRMKNE